MVAFIWRAQVLGPTPPTPVPRPGNATGGKWSVGKCAVLDQQKCRTGRKVRVYRLAQHHWHAHCRRGDDNRKRWVICVNGLSGAHQKLAMMARTNQLLQTSLHGRSEALRVEGIDAAIHERSGEHTSELQSPMY